MSSLLLGGAGPYFTNMTAVEFFDLNTGKWINLPNLERGRYITTTDKHAEQEVCHESRSPCTRSL